MKLHIPPLVAVGWFAVACCQNQAGAVGGLAPTLTTLVSFNGANGEDPLGGLIADTAGNLFGTTEVGGAYGFGTVFEIAKTAAGYASTPTTLVSFCPLANLANCTDGAYPVAGLIADANGNLLGTTSSGDADIAGTVFEIVKTAAGYASTPTTLVSFNFTNGANPFAGLIADANGNLFSTTEVGGAHQEVHCCGTVFEIAKTAAGYASPPTTLVSFCSLANCADGADPTAGLIADANGNLFGTTSLGGANGAGSVFEIAKTAAGYASPPTTLVSFCSLANCADGAVPHAGVIADANGNLFGTTEVGGAHQESGCAIVEGIGGCGTVFEIAKTAAGYASTPTTLVSFCSLANCADGAFPVAGLIADANGNLFGTTFYGGASGGGTVFEIVKTAAGYASSPTTLVSFCSPANCADGADPTAGLIADANGNLYGTTAGGGANGDGTVFEITNSGFVTAPVLLPPSEVAATASGLAYSRVSRTFNGTVTITNISSSPISGPVSILFTGLTAGVTLANATGSFSGSPYLALPTVASLAAGQAATLSVQFDDPSFGPINFTPAVYSGSL